MDRVTLVKHNAVYDRIEADSGIVQEIADHFTFFVPNYKFNPKYRARVWDGKIRLTSVYKPILYSGLRQKVLEFCDSRGYEFVDEASHETPGITEKQILDFIDTIGLPKEINGVPLEVRDYQLEAILRAVNDQRITLISPTASGKSLILYIILRIFNLKTLLIVPRLGLVDQMFADFEEYGYDVDKYVHKVFAGQEKNVDKPIVVSTWQSMKDMDEDYLSQFHVVLGDEVHGFKATELKGIMERLQDCEIRIGVTGSLDGLPTNELVIQGLFGPIHRVATTEELIEQGYLSNLDIDCIVLKHPEDARRFLAKKENSSYQNELDYLISSERRNNFIKNLALNIKGNTLVMYRFVEKHGEVLHKLISAEAKVPVLFVSGKIPSKDREVIRKFVNEQTDSITIASQGTFSTGTNIPNLHSVINTAPTKSKIMILQIIGRILRKTLIKDRAKLYDIADDLVHGTRMNHTLKHFVERVKLYASERFKPRHYQVDL